MDINKIEKVSELIKELKELKRHKEFKQNTKHIEIKPDYGDFGRICVPTRYNKRILMLIDEIIKEIEQEIKEI